jgi:hypothetical protein
MDDFDNVRHDVFPLFEKGELKLQETLANPIRVRPDRSMKNEQFCSQLNTCFKRHMGFRSKRAFRLC